jgi:hypothetical protein
MAIDWTRLAREIKGLLALEQNQPMVVQCGCGKPLRFRISISKYMAGQHIRCPSCTQTAACRDLNPMVISA